MERTTSTSVALVLLFLFAHPLVSHALGTAADAMCVGDPADIWPYDKNKNGVIGVVGKPCSDSTSGFTTSGKCVTVLNCKGNSTSDGKALGDLKGIMDLAKSLMDLLKPKEKPPSNSGGSGSPLNDLYPPCVTNPATGTVSPIPCKNADGSINYGGSSDLGGLLGDTNGGSLLDKLFGDSTPLDEAGGGDSGFTDSGTSTEGTDTNGKEPITPEGDVKELEPGTRGDIVVGEGGVTIVSRTKEGETETATFFGSDARSRLQAQSIIGRLCASRPWSGGFISAIIPASFFDGLCRVGGYQVGIVQLVPNQAPPGTKSFVAPPDVPGEVNPGPPPGTPTAVVWAEPDRVRLGSRTYIFWEATNVVSCDVLGPSFEQHSFSGGASTVPITDSNTFTITCKAQDGNEVTSSVTVDLAI